MNHCGTINWQPLSRKPMNLSTGPPGKKEEEIRREEKGLFVSAPTPEGGRPPVTIALP